MLYANPMVPAGAVAGEMTRRGGGGGVEVTSPQPAIMPSDEMKIRKEKTRFITLSIREWRDRLAATLTIGCVHVGLE